MSGCGCGGGCGGCGTAAAGAAARAGRPQWIPASEAEDPPGVLGRPYVAPVIPSPLLRSIPRPRSVPKGGKRLPVAVVPQEEDPPPDENWGETEVNPEDIELGTTKPYCLEYTEYLPRVAGDRLAGVIGSVTSEFVFACQPHNLPPPVGRTFTVCWGRHKKFREAVQSFRTPNGERELFKSIFESGFLDVPGLDRRSFGDMLAEYLGERTAWDADDPLYGSRVFFGHEQNLDSPRREVMQTALWLIASMEKGVPESYDRFTDVREEVVGRIAKGEMKYYVFFPDQFPGDPVKGTLCSGQGAPLSCSPPIVEKGWCDSRRCPQAEGVVRLHGGIGFNYDISPSVEEVHRGSHHAGRTRKKVVHLCAILVDRAALVYDWFIGLAATHALAAEDPTIAEQAADHRVAQNICLRMALAAAAGLARSVVHETAHNLDLYHCANGRGRKAGCVQDVAAFTWFFYATARLGLPVVSNGHMRTLINWNLDLGYSISPGGRIEYAGIECKQGSMVDEEDDTTWEVANVIIAAAAGAGALVTWGGAFVAYATIAALAGVSAIVNEAVTDSLGTESDATLHVGIDQPLVMGGHLKVCVVTGRSPDCADEPSTECWQSNPPDGVLPCLNQPGGVFDPRSVGGMRVV